MRDRDRATVRTVRGTPLVLLLTFAAMACKTDAARDPQHKQAEPSHKLAGVYPEDWKCDSIVDLKALSDLLGGTAAKSDSPVTPPPGVPHPCNYNVDGATWIFDIDCRDGYKQRADALFAQYRDDSAAMIQHYNELADAGAIKPNDAGTSLRSPEGSTEVDVGAKGLDHHGQGLIFIDDDAPCYVRVIGPDAGKRLALAKLIAKNLTFANAPMTPRPFP